MQIGMIGLGRMGENMVRRLLRAGQQCVIHDKQQAAAEQAAAGRLLEADVVGVACLQAMAMGLTRPRTVWLMVPAGGVDSVLDKTEPYVLAGDVYAQAPHTGRGGWSWYTGAAGWMLRFIQESLLGLRVEADTLQVAPCMPAHWKSFQVHYRYRQTPYHITVRQTPAASGASGLAGLTLDGAALAGPVVPLLDDGREHRVEVAWFGPPAAAGVQ